MTVEAILFDLDGTLVDTAPDLVAVLNRMLADAGRAPMPYAIARNEVSNGSTGLVRLGFGATGPAAEFESLRARFIELYARNVCINSRLYITLDDINDSIYKVGRRWGVVTNKPRAMTVPLLDALGLGGKPGSIVSGDQLPQRKPHPAPLLLAAEELEIAPQRCVYVGDAPRDIEAGRAAGMITIAAAYGYIRPHVDVTAWGADQVARHPRELVAMLGELS